MTFDTIIAVGIVLGAAFYLYRKFSRNSKKGACGCSSGGGCCGSPSQIDSTHCSSTKN